MAADDVRVYMDYTASSPIDPRVVEAMTPYFNKILGNPSSLHSFGNDVRGPMNEARNKVGQLIGAVDPSREIIFTSGATESSNIAIKGTAYRARGKNHLITTTVEHMSILNITKALMKEGYATTLVPVDEYGMVDPAEIEKAITEKTFLISCNYANGEVGTIQPIKEIGKIARDNKVYFHVDGVAAIGKIPVNVVDDNIDLLSISSNDLFGPKGTGALYIRKGVSIQGVLQGGGQERGIRSGTEDIPSIVGFGKAAEIIQQEMDGESNRLEKIRDRLIKEILQIPESYLNGHPTNRLPNNVHVRFSYIEGESLILDLDEKGIACSSGSACTAKTLEPSHVLRAMGLPHELVHGSILFTMGRWTKETDSDRVIEVLPPIVKRLRDLSPLTPLSLKED
ncbi:MAG: aminotransferase class V-fold PLP-dependent enzyme [Candidatus Lokiarchaeota archaeon]|nr:aminotransferase class V-fold PLP-dependent enzyme [Candidatus Lokiarchaeota archaeon]